MDIDSGPGPSGPSREIPRSNPTDPEDFRKMHDDERVANEVDLLAARLSAFGRQAHGEEDAMEIDGGHESASQTQNRESRRPKAQPGGRFRRVDLNFNRRELTPLCQRQGQQHTNKLTDRYKTSRRHPKVMEDYDRNRDRQRGPRNYGSRKRGRGAYRLL